MKREGARACISHALALAHDGRFNDAESILTGMVDSLLDPDSAARETLRILLERELEIDTAYQESLDISRGY